MKCDGLQFPCENEATHSVVLLVQPEGTPPVIAMQLCDQCHATWQSWMEENERRREVEDEQHRIDERYRDRQFEAQP